MVDRLDKNSFLMDVGANIGLYSIYAAKKNIKGVLSIEPESQNFAILNKNIYLNNLSNKITTLNIGFSDKNGIEKTAKSYEAICNYIQSELKW